MNTVIEKFKEVEQSNVIKRIIFTNIQLGTYIVFWRPANDEYSHVGCEEFDLQSDECFNVTTNTYEELDEFLDTYTEYGWTLNN